MHILYNPHSYCLFQWARTEVESNRTPVWVCYLNVQRQRRCFFLYIFTCVWSNSNIVCWKIFLFIFLKFSKSVGTPFHLPIKVQELCSVALRQVSSTAVCRHSCSVNCRVSFARLLQLVCILTAYQVCFCFHFKDSLILFSTGLNNYCL